MPDGTQVTIKPAKGRPVLTWVASGRLRQVTAYAAQHGEAFTPRPDWQADPAMWPGGHDGRACRTCRALLFCEPML